MTTRCKFKCTSVAHMEYGAKVTLSAVHGSDINNEDHAFQKATPSGELTMSLSHNPEFFTPGKCYYLDITEVPAT